MQWSVFCYLYELTDDHCNYSGKFMMLGSFMVGKAGK